MLDVKTSYIICNKTINSEIRVYFDSSNVEGQILYKGHKLGITDTLLLKILYYKYEKFNNRYFFINYKKWIDLDYTAIDNNISLWDSVSNLNSKELFQRWYLLLNEIKNINGKVPYNINITLIKNP